MSEARLHPRGLVCLDMWLQGGLGRLLPCTMANTSPAGAQLCIGNDYVLPTFFTLRPTRPGEAHKHCRLIWRRGDRAGVKFITA